MPVKSQIPNRLFLGVALVVFPAAGLQTYARATKRGKEELPRPRLKLAKVFEARSAISAPPAKPASTDYLDGFRLRHKVAPRA